MYIVLDCLLQYVDIGHFFLIHNNEYSHPNIENSIPTGHQKFLGGQQILDICLKTNHERKINE